MDVDAFLRRAKAQAVAADRLVRRLRLTPQDRALNVHSYGWKSYEAFVRRYYDDERPRVFAISMNPGPNGAVQTGIPFTDRILGRQILPDFDSLCPGPPQWARSDRQEQSGLRVQEWARRSFGGIEGLYQRVFLAMTFPIGILRGPACTNVPLPALPGPDRALAEGFIRDHAPGEVEAAQPSGVLLLGTWAALVWKWVLAERPALGRLRSRATPHPAAHIPHASKYRAWTRGYKALQPTSRDRVD